ncbi:hypothetical protein MO973_25090 [Paenibacillus sp. TRM 82003]|nr:hypothetical protein [Paenibacillus sp. TRM 82003]
MRAIKLLTPASSYAHSRRDLVREDDPLPVLLLRQVAMEERRHLLRVIGSAH